MYPLKFVPQLKERIWGGNKLAKNFGKPDLKNRVIGESWEISAVQGDVSIVKNGILAGNDLEELIEIYMGDLVGEKVYDQFGEEFPLLIKLIDAQQLLSIQVHPNDELALERHGAYGKTELWYVVDCEPDAYIYVGFNRKITAEEYQKHLKENTLESILKKEMVKKGDTYYIPAGTIHAIGKGVVVAEIQQTSDITYRVFDWNRVDNQGKSRELHTELAQDAIDFGEPQNYKISGSTVDEQGVSTIKTCKYFSVKHVTVTKPTERDYSSLDSFVILFCVEGSLELNYNDGKESLALGETILIPASETSVTISGKGSALEIFIP